MEGYTVITANNGFQMIFDNRPDLIICSILMPTEFEHLGNRKILFNTGLSPSWDAEPIEKWLNDDNVLYCDTFGALGEQRFLKYPNVTCLQVST